VIADCQLPIFDWRRTIKPIGNRKSEIENSGTHPLPRLCGTDDLIPKLHHAAGGLVLCFAKEFIMAQAKPGDDKL
jgi:hypothetical protein